MNKVELFRQGESTLERYYPPWMKVVYYRYLRFFPDGVVFMLTSSYDPITVISQLRSHGAQVEGMCRGMYRMKENQVGPLLLLLLLLFVFSCRLLLELFNYMRPHTIIYLFI